MSNEVLHIEIQESGARVVARRMKEVQDAVDKVGSSTRTTTAEMKKSREVLDRQIRAMSQMNAALRLEASGNSSAAATMRVLNKLRNDGVKLTEAQAHTVSVLVNEERRLRDQILQSAAAEKARTRAIRESWAERGRMAVKATNFLEGHRGEVTALKADSRGNSTQAALIRAENAARSQGIFLTKQQSRELAGLVKQQEKLTRVTQARSGGGGGGLGLGGLVGVAGTAMAVKGLIDMADAYTNLRNRIKTAAGDNADLEETTNRLFDVANKTRTGIEETTMIYQRASRAGARYGATQERIIRFTETLNMATQVGGANHREATMAIIQLSQAMSAGRLSGDELRSVMEQMPEVAKIVADQLGVTTGELKELGKQGKITGRQMFLAMEKAAPRIAEEYKKMTPTVAQSMTVLRNQMIRWVGTSNEAHGITAKLSEGIIFLSNHLDEAAKAAIALGAAMAAIFSQRMITSIAGVISKVVQLSKFLLMTPFGLILTTLGLIVGITTDWGKDTEKLKGFFEDVLEVVKGIYNWIAGAFGKLVSSVAWVAQQMQNISDSLGLGYDITNDRRRQAYEKGLLKHEGYESERKRLNEERRALNKNPEAMTVAEAGIRRMNAQDPMKRAGPGKPLDYVPGYGKTLGRDQAGAWYMVDSAKGMQKIHIGSAEDKAFLKRLDAVGAAADKIEQGQRTNDRDYDAWQKQMKKQLAEGTVILPGVKGGDKPVGGLGPDKPATDKEAARRVKQEHDQFLKALQGLADELYPIIAAQRQFSEAQGLVNRAVAEGILTQERGNEMMERKKMLMEEQLHPFETMMDNFEEEKKLLEMNTDARELYVRQQELEKQLWMTGETVTQARRDAIKLETEEIQRRTKAKEMEESVDRRVAAKRQEIRQFREGVLNPGKDLGVQKKRLDRMVSMAKTEEDLVRIGLAMRNVRYEQLRLAEGGSDWEQSLRGIDMAAIRIRETIRQTAQETEQVLLNAFGSVEQFLVTMTTEFRLDFRSLISSLLSDMTKLTFHSGLKAIMGEDSKGIAEKTAESAAQAAPFVVAGITMDNAGDKLIAAGLSVGTAAVLMYGAAAAMAAATAVSGGGAGTGAFGSGGVAGIAGMLLGLQTGGQFMVGGRPGPDANPVLLGLTRGERVTVETQRMQRENAGGGANVQSIVVFDADGVNQAIANSPSTKQTVRDVVRVDGRQMARYLSK